MAVRASAGLANFRRWTSSVFRELLLSDDAQQQSPPGSDCCSACAGAGGGMMCNTGCMCTGSSGWTSDIKPLTGPTAQYLVKGTVILPDGIRYPIWRLVEPGAWEMRFYRPLESTDPGTAVEPGVALVGKIAQVVDVYGNRHDYDYYLFDVIDAPGDEDSRLALVTCIDATGATQAYILFDYNLDSSSELSGTLSKVEVLRRNPLDSASAAPIPVQRVWYEYVTEENSDTAPLGSLGDLIEVRVDERVDPAPGDTSGDAVWHTSVTQYRYHGGVDEGTGDTDGDGYLGEIGAKHQLKMVINPEQVEYFAVE